jgi:hypothetical protein
MLLTRAREIVDSNLGRGTEYPDMYFMIFLISPDKCQNNTSNQLMTSYFHILSNSLYSAIRLFDTI